MLGVHQGGWCEPRQRREQNGGCGWCRRLFIGCTGPWYELHGSGGTSGNEDLRVDAGDGRNARIDLEGIAEHELQGNAAAEEIASDRMVSIACGWLKRAE